MSFFGIQYMIDALNASQEYREMKKEEYWREIEKLEKIDYKIFQKTYDSPFDKFPMTSTCLMDVHELPKGETLDYMRYFLNENVKTVEVIENAKYVDDYHGRNSQFTQYVPGTVSFTMNGENKINTIVFTCSIGEISNKYARIMNVDQCTFEYRNLPFIIVIDDYYSYSENPKYRDRHGYCYVPHVVVSNSKNSKGSYEYISHEFYNSKKNQEFQEVVNAYTSGKRTPEMAKLLPKEPEKYFSFLHFILLHQSSDFARARTILSIIPALTVTSGK